MKAVGLMSGTSADGVDAALVNVSERSGRIKVGLAAFQTYPYSSALRKKVFSVGSGEANNTAALAELDVKLGEVFAKAALRVCEKAGVNPAELTYVASHGQTVGHFPERRATVQLADGAVIAARTGACVVEDFRPADMARGGQGAPLTPMADFHFFRHPKKTRLVVNIGGITNVTILPAGANSADEVSGFDVGFGNMVLDGMAGRISGGRKSYDKNGKLAERGNVREEWLKKILAHPFLRKRPPKSAGREQFGKKYLDGLEKKLGVRSREKRLDLLATLTEAVTRATGDAIRRFGRIKRVDEVLLCGGGAKNPLLFEGFRRNLNSSEVTTTDALGIPSDAREAMAFALLGYLTLKKRPGNVPAATGARSKCVLGKVIYP